MAIKRTIQAGDISLAAQWDGGTLPVAGDECYLDYAGTLPDAATFPATGSVLSLDLAGAGGGSLACDGTCSLNADTITALERLDATFVAALSIVGDCYTTVNEAWTAYIDAGAITITGSVTAGGPLAAGLGVGAGMELLGGELTVTEGIVAEGLGTGLYAGYLTIINGNIVGTSGDGDGNIGLWYLYTTITGNSIGITGAGAPGAGSTGGGGYLDTCLIVGDVYGIAGDHAYGINHVGGATISGKWRADVGEGGVPFAGVPAGFGLVIPYSQANPPAVGNVKAEVVYGEADEFTGTRIDCPVAKAITTSGNYGDPASPLVGLYVAPADSDVWYQVPNGVPPGAGTKRASSITNCEPGNIVTGVTIDDVSGAYPTTATSKAEQYAEDQAAVLAEADSIILGEIILEQVGTFDLEAWEAPRNIDPGIANVRDGTSYRIYDVPLVGVMPPPGRLTVEEIKITVA